MHTEARYLIQRSTGYLYTSSSVRAVLYRTKRYGTYIIVLCMNMYRTVPNDTMTSFFCALKSKRHGIQEQLIAT